MYKKKIAVLGFLLILLSSLSGCVHVELGKDVLGERRGELVLAEQEKAVMKHYFQTEIFNPESYTYYGHNATDVPLDTKWLKVYIKITLEPLPADLPISLPEDIRRFVHLTVQRADGTEWLNIEWTETTEDTITINTPLPGTWSFTIDAAGYGDDLVSYHDGFKIIVKTLEPK